MAKKEKTLGDLSLSDLVSANWHATDKGSSDLVDILIGLNKAVDAYWNGVGTLNEERAVTDWQKKSKQALQEHGYVD